MPRPDYTTASLRVWGDDLVPEEISHLLGASSTMSERKGDTRVGRATGKLRVAKAGLWRLSAPERRDGDLDRQIEELFAELTSDAAVWRNLASRYGIDVFCGVFMKAGNDGLVFEPATLRLLGERGARLNLDIYDSNDG